jgi:hypothetical protein
MAKKIDLGLPDKLAMAYTGSGFEISRKWFGWQIIFLTFFAIFWDGFLFFWYSMAFVTGSAIMMLFPLIHVAVGIGITYTALAGWVNTTRITVNQGRIAVRHGPLPWIGQRDLDASDVKQLYSKEKISRGRNSTTTTYEVHAVTHTGKNVKLLSGLESSEQALYIEQEIERYFRIEDAPVKGQIGE